MVFQCKKNTCKTDAGTFFRLYRRKNPRPETRTGIITCYNTTGKITLPTLIYSCFWRVLRSKLLLQASLHRTLDLFTLVYTIHVNYLAAAAFASLIFSLCFMKKHPTANPMITAKMIIISTEGVNPSISFSFSFYLLEIKTIQT